MIGDFNRLKGKRKMKKFLFICTALFLSMITTGYSEQKTLEDESEEIQAAVDNLWQAIVDSGVTGKDMPPAPEEDYLDNRIKLWEEINDPNIKPATDIILNSEYWHSITQSKAIWRVSLGISMAIPGLITARYAVYQNDRAYYTRPDITRREAVAAIKAVIEAKEKELVHKFPHGFTEGFGMSNRFSEAEILRRRLQK